MPWFWLILGGLFEVGFTTSLRFVDGFRNVPWTIAFLISVAISMGILARQVAQLVAQKLTSTTLPAQAWVLCAALPSSRV